MPGFGFTPDLAVGVFIGFGNPAGEALAKQFDGYKPLSDLGMNGQQTLSENIADLAGLTASTTPVRRR